MNMQQLNTDYIAAFNAGHAAALAALFTEDAVVMNSFGATVCGRSAILTALEHSFAGPCRGATLQINPQQSKNLSADIVLELGTTRTTRNTQPPTHRDFTYTKVFKRQGTEWKLAVAHFGILEPSTSKSS